MLTVPETAALLGAMRGTARLMAALIYGGGLQVSECCQLRVLAGLWLPEALERKYPNAARASQGAAQPGTHPLDLLHSRADL